MSKPKAEDNLQMVHYLLNKYFHIDKSNSNYDDWFQVGCMGLIKACNEFDESLGYKLSTYAIHKMHGEIQRYMRDRDNPVKVPRKIKQLNFKIQKLCKDTILLHDDDYCEWLAEQTESTIDEVREAIKMGEEVYGRVSIDKQIGTISNGEKEIKLSDTIKSSADIQQETENKLVIQHIMANLTDIEREVLQLYYFEEMTQQQIANIVNENQVQVSRIIKKALMKSRRLIE